MELNIQQIKNLAMFRQKIMGLVLIGYFSTPNQEKEEYVNYLKGEYGLDLYSSFPELRECRRCRRTKNDSK